MFDVRRWKATLAVTVSLTLGVGLAGCGAARPADADWPPLGKKWFERARASFRSGDVEDADESIANALRIVGKRAEVRLLAAKIALAQLEYDRAIELLEGMSDSDARSTRGRALWYSGQIDKAADELEALTSDPDVRDAWAVDVGKLARRGSGRKPFELVGGLLAVTDMPPTGTASLLVPVEVNGEDALGLIATGTAEAVLDSSGGAEASWISLRFGGRVEVRDVPALARDLSGISRQVNAPIKLLIGANLLRHLHPTFDFAGSQFVVRTMEPPPPPAATTVKVSYARGGGMLMRGGLQADENAPMASLLIDTSMTYPLALDDGGWKKAGILPSSLQAVPNSRQLRQGLLPIFRIGAFEVPELPCVHGAPVGELEKGLDMDLDGLVGAGLLAAFRVTLVDAGRTMWLEPMPSEAMRMMRPSRPSGGGAPAPAAPSSAEPTPPPRPAAAPEKPAANPKTEPPDKPKK